MGTDLRRWAMQTLGRFLLWLSTRIEQIRPLPTRNWGLVDDDRRPT